MSIGINQIQNKYVPYISAQSASSIRVTQFSTNLGERVLSIERVDTQVAEGGPEEVLLGAVLEQR